MRIALYEGDAARGFGPIVLMRPLFELVCGQISTRERWQRWCAATGRDLECAAFVRSELRDVYAEQSGFPVNDYEWLQQGQTLLINGRWLARSDAALELGPDDVAICEGEIVAMSVEPAEALVITEDNWSDAIPRIAQGRNRIDVSGCVLRHPWDEVNANDEQLRIDFQSCDQRRGREDLGSHVAVMGARDQVWIDRTAEVHPFVTLDARSGPISIAAGAVIQSFTRIAGPCHIGPNAQLFRAQVSGGTTIGPVCRVGGEVEASILHGYVNKYHDGFLGHSYVCPWTNLGALTTNSDLKNDYSPVRVPLFGKPIDSGEKKIGSYIGDHTKMAIGSLMNTGSSIGVMSVVLPGGELLPKHVPSFSRIWHGELQPGWDVARHLDTARTAMGRRGIELTAAEEHLLRHLERRTFAEREAALTRSREKRALKQPSISD